MAQNSIIDLTLDDYFKSTSIGSIDRAIGNNLYGINHRQTPNAVPSNKDSYGLTFFTRPQINLQTDNIRNVRQFYPLLTDQSLTVQAAIRCLLDPRIMQGYSFHNLDSGKNTVIESSFTNQAFQTPLVDNKMAFLSILTNNLNSISGWPDIVSPTFTSKSGLFNEVYSQVDGIVRNYESYDIDATFRNTKGDPIIYMFYIWLHYMSAVFKGDIVPYLDFISENEIDYNTRIYRLVLDRYKNKVTKIGATGAAFPISVPTGSFFDYNNDKPFNDQNKDFTIRFRCMGAEYQDDILIYEFNRTVIIFNPEMEDGVRQRYMTKLPLNKLTEYNFRGYPRIDTQTYELEWWVPISTYSARSTNFFEQNLQNTPAETTNPNEVPG